MQPSSNDCDRCECGAIEGTEHECDVRTVRMDTPDMMPTEEPE